MILVVCTGNLHRSALLEAIFKSSGFIDVESAGTRAPGGGAPPLMLQAATEAGFDLASHTSRQVTIEMLADAELVIAMERAHVAELCVMFPDAFNYTVTLRELRDLMVETPPTRGESLASWLSGVLADRRTTDVLAASHVRDTPDPIGGSLSVFRSCVSDIGATAAPVIEGLRVLLAPR